MVVVVSEQQRKTKYFMELGYKVSIELLENIAGLRQCISIQRNINSITLFNSQSQTNYYQNKDKYITIITRLELRKVKCGSEAERLWLLQLAANCWTDGSAIRRLKERQAHCLACRIFIGTMTCFPPIWECTLLEINGCKLLVKIIKNYIPNVYEHGDWPCS